MKNVIISFLMFSIFQNSILFAQDTNDEPVQKLIMKTTWFTSHPFQLFDGTPLDYKDIYTLTGGVPGNSRLVNQAKPWRVVSISLIGVSLVSCLFQVYNVAFPNTLDNPSFYGNMAAWTTLSTFGGSILAGMIYHDKVQKLVNNYNLHIMGIPVN
jgi:membrane associated rhomboid family serine protease